MPCAPDAPSLHRVQGASGAQGVTEQSCQSLVVFTLQLLAMLPYSAAVSAVEVQEYPADAPLWVPILFASPWTAPPPAIAPNPAQPQPQQQSRSYPWQTPPCCQNICLLPQPILEQLRHALHLSGCWGPALPQLMSRLSALTASVHASSFYGHEAAFDGLLALPLQAIGHHSSSWVTAALAPRVTW